MDVICRIISTRIDMTTAATTLPYTIRRSQRARNVRLVVKPAGIELVVPPHVGEAQALQFLRQNRAWAERKLSELQGRANIHLSLARPLLESGSTVPFQGREVPLLVRPGSGRRIRIVRQGEGPFEIEAPPGSPSQTDEQIQAALFAWMKTWLYGEAARIALRQGPSFDLQPRCIRVKRMKTRWGSCGPLNDINLNWLLAFAPASVLEYVVVHELCHIRHRNHSAAFWDLVARHFPEWRRERRWLKTNGGELLRRFT
jgi:hypothetical protein